MSATTLLVLRTGTPQRADGERYEAIPRTKFDRHILHTGHVESIGTVYTVGLSIQRNFTAMFGPVRGRNGRLSGQLTADETPLPDH